VLENALNHVNALASPMLLEPKKYDAKHYVYYAHSVYSSKFPLSDLRWVEAADKLMGRYELQIKSTSTLDQRKRIAPQIRDAVWRRDRGQCTKCGSRERLEFDHIIPVSKGGSSTERNLELLCESCNRSKGPQVG
jgi:5-methylcytosine-specific restriction endonuclease McrA